jgi:glycine betaine/choline ABC-type transport system substrate-binding protein
VRNDAFARIPALADTLNLLAGKLTDETMQRLNYEVDEKGLKAPDVAMAFLVGQGLLPAGAQPGDGSAGQVRVGGKQFTEQEILGEMMALLLECKANVKVVRKLNLGGTMICFNALKSGDLDLYAEYTGTGLVNILKRDVITDPEEAYRTVKEQFAEEYGMTWLKPFGFNNTYTLTMRKDHAAELGIATISELAELLNQSHSP